MVRAEMALLWHRIRLILNSLVHLGTLPLSSQGVYPGVCYALFCIALLCIASSCIDMFRKSLLCIALYALLWIALLCMSLVCTALLCIDRLCIPLLNIACSALFVGFYIGLKAKAAQVG